jgi:hypothetical protein
MAVRKRRRRLTFISHLPVDTLRVANDMGVRRLTLDTALITTERIPPRIVLRWAILPCSRKRARMASTDTTGPAAEPPPLLPSQRSRSPQGKLSTSDLAHALSAELAFEFPGLAIRLQRFAEPME